MTSSLTRGRPRSSAKRTAIIDAATDVFLREGYARASVDAIAAAAGVSKQTVYTNFGNKEGLFLAVAENARTAADGSHPVTVQDTGNLRTDLIDFGVRLLQTVLAPQVSALHRMTIAELVHHPELLELWRDNEGSAATQQALADYLAENELPSAALRARQFVMLLGVEGRVQSAYGSQPLERKQLRQIAADTTDLILGAPRPS
ncbi:TetR/AcrR family transcriptional regulator [Amycolatopsis rubida]|uniref:TetR/AcrR family transcriptional regulator n=1 Tax=Amycolatopsis rubida TaxID=112413 RepID=A0ABX0CC02_9PSEU|nr:MULTISPECIES: TetR/AcrR family transcriptional regulator [Amycolatopsis]MYW97957.1 TetR family transcriptional regulator [Amycolatopsis rubida]NEC62942.1 TetR/AcrR family transcriptional regulator [Amycolatopsis rubida]